VDLASVRDVVIIVFAVLGVAASITVIVVSVILYRRAEPILNSAKDTLANMRATSSIVSETVAKPIIAVFSWVKGGSRTFSALARLTRKKGEGK
jgi:hypothetical protein